MSGESSVSRASVQLDRDVFLRSLVRELAGALENVVGLPEASGYISLVGAAMGEQINSEYKAALGLDKLSRTQVASVLIDLKRRIQGRFTILEENEEKIVFGNTLCPFAEKVIGRPSMCMMTSNVFGHIASQNLGYAKVELQKTIANGDEGCRVVVYLNPDAAKLASGREYFQG